MLQHAVQLRIACRGMRSGRFGVYYPLQVSRYMSMYSARAGGSPSPSSHNPAECNALKLFNQRGLFFNNYEREELIDLYHQSEFYQAGNEEDPAMSVRTSRRLPRSTSSGY